MNARASGSRFLYAPFEVTEARMEANERVLEERLASLSHRLQGIEQAIERLERRLWLAVFGVLSVVLAQVVRDVLLTTPGP